MTKKVDWIGVNMLFGISNTCSVRSNIQDHIQDANEEHDRDCVEKGF